MTIFKSAYDTTACRNYIMNETVNALQSAFVKGGLTQVSSLLGKDLSGVNWEVFTVETLGRGDIQIPTFAHPVIFDLPNHSHKIAVDIRGTGSFNMTLNKFVVRNTTEANMSIARAAMNRIWIDEDPSIIRNFSSLPVLVFSSLISEAVARRFALNALEQMNIAIVSAIYYYSLFRNDGEIDEREKIKITSMLTQAMKVNAKHTLTILDIVTTTEESGLSDLASLCRIIRRVVDNVRLDELNPGVLFGIVGGTWFGTNAKELMAVALEHPPTWVVILMSAIQDRSYKNAIITKLVERGIYKEQVHVYPRAFMNLFAIY